MAIYQFYLAPIPKKGIIEYFGEIPKKLEFDLQKRTVNLHGEIEDEFDYFEIIQHKCWDLAKISGSEIISKIDEKLDRAGWGNGKESHNWKIETKNLDNDAWILTEGEQNHIKEFNFRADLRQPRFKFLWEMVELANEYDLFLMDRKGNLVEPEMENVIKLVEKSNSWKFVVNPNIFLTDLQAGKIKIE